MKKDPEVFIEHILDCMEKIARYPADKTKEYQLRTLKSLLILFPVFSLSFLI